MSIEDQLGISGIGQRREAQRAGLEDLNRIKTFSDENLTIIKESFDESDNESKRSLAVNLIAALDYYFMN